MRSVVVTVGPLAAASATKISASQSVPGATAIVIDGAAASNYSATAIATTTGNGAGTTAVTLNGARVVSSIAYLVPPSQVVLVSAGDDSTKTWTVTGTASDNLTFQSETVAAANASRVATTKIYGTILSVTLSAASAGNVSVGTNGEATLDMARRVLFTSSGTDTGITFTITGGDWSGNSISETLAGGSAGSPVYTLLSYKTVAKIVASGATAGTLTVGTNGVADSQWVRFDDWGFRDQAFQCVLSGSATYTVEGTFDDPNSATNPVLPAAVTWDTTAVPVSGGTASTEGTFTYTPKFARIRLTTGTGSVTGTFTQYNTPAR